MFSYFFDFEVFSTFRYCCVLVSGTLSLTSTLVDVRKNRPHKARHWQQPQFRGETIRNLHGRRRVGILEAPRNR